MNNLQCRRNVQQSIQEGVFQSLEEKYTEDKQRLGTISETTKNLINEKIKCTKVR